MAADKRDWFRSPKWTPEIQEQFEQRLRRARAANRAQYIRIQGTHLVESPNRADREAGRALLRRVIADYGEDAFHSKTAMEQLGTSLAKEGMLAEAEEALRETLRMCAASPIGRSGTTGVTELLLAEVILATGDVGRVDEATSLLEVVQPEVQRMNFLRNVVFRFLLASARVARLRRDPDARQLAREALAVASETKPALPRHPDVGRPQASPSEIAELQRMIATV